MREPRLPNATARPQTFACALVLLFVVEPLARSSPLSTLWTVPCILFASIVIAWGAEAAQFFIAQGFALAILAWMQTMPEFAVERKSTRLNSSHVSISYAVFCLKKKKCTRPSSWLHALQRPPAPHISPLSIA